MKGRSTMPAPDPVVIILLLTFLALLVGGGIWWMHRREQKMRLPAYQEAEEQVTKPPGVQ